MWITTTRHTRPQAETQTEAEAGAETEMEMETDGGTHWRLPGRANKLITKPRTEN